MMISQPSCLRSLIILLITSILWTTGSWAEEVVTKDKPTPEPITTNHTDIPIDELELLLKPLETDELKIEAWQGLLRAKVEEVSAAEIAVQKKKR